MEKNPLQKLADHGQSVWLDFISRRLVISGELQRLIREDNVTGLTSNPTIFQKSLAESTDYDEQLQSLMKQGIVSPDDLFMEIAVTDIQHATDILRPVYDRTKGADGFASIEVPPALAHDTVGTVRMATTLWHKVNRPNCMVKVPATPEGIPAIQQLIANGININVTLIFALSAYEAVAEAYIKGLEQRLAKGEHINIHSVASFFVSRIDTATDTVLEEKLKADPSNAEMKDLLGKAAIANAQLAYESFEKIFHGDRFRALRDAGAHVQRPLWASTSAKNPKYRDVVYAEALIGPDTVDTMPPATIDAFRDHGVVERDTVKEDYASAHAIFQRLHAVGIDMEAVTNDVLNAGVSLFADSYNQLIDVLASESDELRGDYAHHQHFDISHVINNFDAVLHSDSSADIARRMWAHDPNLWKPGDTAHAAVIKNRLGWLTVMDTMQQHVGTLVGMADAIRDEGIRDVVLLGMGGSSLCPEVLRTSFGSSAGYPTLHVLDTTDPATIAAVTRAINPRTTVFIVASKSGKTVETLSHMEHFWNVVKTAGVDDPGHHFIAITDPGTSLAATAQQRNFRHIFDNPPDIGGRYSALSYFGLVPAALMGIDIQELLNRATRMAAGCRGDASPATNCGLALGLAMGMMHDIGRDKVTIIAPMRIAWFSLWAEQLIAESTGKEGKGIIPISAESVGDPSVYANDRVFVALTLNSEPDAEFDARVAALKAAGYPVIELELTDLYDLGAEFFRWEFATAVAGSMLHIDAFDEPNVQESKDNTNKLLNTYMETGQLPQENPSLMADGIALYGKTSAAAVEDAVAQFVSAAQPGDYVALMAYVPYDGEVPRAIHMLRNAIRDTTKCATTFGVGPRFLHSTGQLHKGGPNTGVYIQITGDDAMDVDIPGQKYTFSVLKKAQAQGDLQSLRDHGRRVISLHISGDVPTALNRLCNTITILSAAVTH